MSRIILIGASAKSLITFRGTLIMQLVEKGHEVYCIADENDSIREQIEKLGATFVASPVDRTSKNPLGDLRLCWFYHRIFKSLNPEYVISYTIKPVIWSGIASRFHTGIHYYPMITGLGYVFCGNSFKKRFLRLITTRLYKLSLKKAHCVFFQNNDDREELQFRGLLNGIKTSLLPGSGVPVNHYHFTPIPDCDNGLEFVMVARLLKDKGVYHFVEAAKVIQQMYPKTRFTLVGGLDPSPNCVSKREVEIWNQEGIVNQIGAVNDVRPYLEKAHVFVLPSFYREGLPRSILEAMSTGRPILTTDNVGCREPIEDGHNGFIIKPRSTKALIEKLTWFIEHSDQIHVMGAASRRIAEEVYDVYKVNQKMFDIMGL